MSEEAVSAMPEQRFLVDVPAILDNGRRGLLHIHRCDACFALTANYGDALMHARSHVVIPSVPMRETPEAT